MDPNICFQKSKSLSGKRALDYVILHCFLRYDCFISLQFPAVVDLNVGGRHFTTHLSTLTKEPDSMLAAMFSGRHPCSKDKDGRFFIDADGEIFYHILNYLRFDEIPSGDMALSVYKQARYYGLQSLIGRLESYSSVQFEKYLEKIRSAYPWYRDMIEKCFEDLNNRQLNQIGVNVNISFLLYRMSEEEMCPGCRKNVWKSVADDPRGEALEYLIRHELKIRNFYIPDVTTSKQSCQFRLQQQAMGYTGSWYGLCGTQIRNIQIRLK